MKTEFFGEKDADVCLLQPVDRHALDMMDSEYAYIQEHTSKKIFLAAVLVDDWNKDLSPWEAPPVFGKEGFGDGAAETLSYIETNVVPELLGGRHAPAQPEAEEGTAAGDTGRIPIILGGYSLAGLFALWSVYQTDLRAAGAAASPSVWFPGWIDYAASHPVKTGSVYLSLGDREKKTRNPVMATVADCIEKQAVLLDGLPHTLEWNPGNHFVDSDIRTAKGFVWAIRFACQIDTIKYNFCK